MQVCTIYILSLLKNPYYFKINNLEKLVLLWILILGNLPLIVWKNHYHKNWHVKYRYNNARCDGSLSCAFGTVPLHYRYRVYQVPNAQFHHQDIIMVNSTIREVKIRDGILIKAKQTGRILQPLQYINVYRDFNRNAFLIRTLK